MTIPKLITYDIFCSMGKDLFKIDGKAIVDNGVIAELGEILMAKYITGVVKRCHSNHLDRGPDLIDNNGIVYEVKSRAMRQFKIKPLEKGIIEYRIDWQNKSMYKIGKLNTVFNYLALCEFTEYGILLKAKIIPKDELSNILRIDNSTGLNLIDKSELGKIIFPQ